MYKLVCIDLHSHGFRIEEPLNYAGCLKNVSSLDLLLIAQIENKVVTNDKCIHSTVLKKRKDYIQVCDLKKQVAVNILSGFCN